jgi:hypothetical protein
MFIDPATTLMQGTLQAAPHVAGVFPIICLKTTKMKTIILIAQAEGKSRYRRAGYRSRRIDRKNNFFSISHYLTIKN